MAYMTTAQALVKFLDNQYVSFDQSAAVPAGKGSCNYGGTKAFSNA